MLKTQTSLLKRGCLLSVAVVVLVLAVVACGGSDDGSDSPPATADATLSVLLMARDVGVGEARLPIVVLLSDENRTRLNDRLDDLSFAYRHIDDESFVPLNNVVWREWPVRGGAYTTSTTLDRPGVWEVQVTLEEQGKKRVGSTFVQVEPESSAPAVGSMAPVTRTKTASTIDEVRQISSAFDPDTRFYSLSLDEALANRKPTVVLFSTPAFCVTQTCGPQLETLGELLDRHEGEIDFVHVEIFDNIREMLDTGNNNIGEVAQPVEDWGLITEPWTFFVDADGIITARFEQFTTLEELTEATNALLAAG